MEPIILPQATEELANLFVSIFLFVAGVYISYSFTRYIVKTLQDVYEIVNDESSLSKQMPKEIVIDLDSMFEAANSSLSGQTEKPKRKEKRKNSELAHDTEFIYVHTDDPELIEAFRNDRETR